MTTIDPLILNTLQFIGHTQEGIDHHFDVRRQRKEQAERDARLLANQKARPAPSNPFQAGRDIYRARGYQAQHREFLPGRHRGGFGDTSLRQEPGQHRAYVGQRRKPVEPRIR